ncbi:uncharacterized protein LOC132195353 [Neocloeon triangulifer]|uniref:uncharacterized protein LOC132195353 n=1 Tax=Neocloeon triangulifer TaxID=2078957 RepID=UPI00286F8891|nr:uncharacterized protein LOC132195353 [Neocloeon triangulifer]
MLNIFKLFKLTLMIIILSLQESSGAKRKTDTSPCGYRIIKRLENCCAFPELIANDVFVSCHEELKINEQPQQGGLEISTEQSGKRLKKYSASAKKRGTRDATYKVGWGGGRSLGTYRGGRKSQGQAMCIYDCVLRNQSLIQSDGEIDTTKMEKSFTDSAPSEWKQIIKDAFSECSGLYRKVKQSSLPAPKTSSSGRTCRFGPALYMSCLRRYFTLNCPQSSILSIDNTCKEKIDLLKTCDPFKVRGSAGRAGKYWGAAEVDEEKAPESAQLNVAPKNVASFSKGKRRRGRYN